MTAREGTDLEGEGTDRTREQRPHYPRLLQAIWLLVVALLVQTALTVLSEVLGRLARHPLTQHPASIAVVNLLAFGPIIIWGLRKTKAPFTDVFPCVPVRPALFVPMGLTVIGAGILLSECDNLLRAVLPAPPVIADLLNRLAGARTSLWGSLLVLVIVAPVTEELLFRGIILRGFLSHYGPGKAILASALLFALFHVNPWQFVSAAWLGALFAWWFVRTRSLVPCLFGHALSNGMPSIVGRVFHLNVPGYTSEMTTHVVFQPLWFDCVGLLLAGAGVWLFLRVHGRTNTAVRGGA